MASADVIETIVKHLRATYSPAVKGLFDQPKFNDVLKNLVEGVYDQQRALAALDFASVAAAGNQYLMSFAPLADSILKHVGNEKENVRSAAELVKTMLVTAIDAAKTLNEGKHLPKPVPVKPLVLSGFDNTNESKVFAGAEKMLMQNAEVSIGLGAILAMVSGYGLWKGFTGEEIQPQDPKQPQREPKEPSFLSSTAGKALSALGVTLGITVAVVASKGLRK